MKKLLFFASAAALLASCSTDLTENVSAPVLGKSKIVASYEVGGENTRTHLENGKTYQWDTADAIGVFVNSEDGDNTNATFKYEGKVDGKGVFGGDFDMLDGAEYAVYYPWANGTALAADGTVNMEIPALQNFNHQVEASVEKGGFYAGTFAQNTAPGVGVGVAEGEGENMKMDVTFKGVASYLIFPIQGFGTIKSATLKIEDNALTGEGTVKVGDEKPALTLTNKTATVDENDAITLNCGKGVVLDYSKSKNFWFVVPVLDETTSKDITLTVVNTDGEEQTFTRQGFAAMTPNTAYILGDGEKDWVFNPTGSYIVANEFDFIKYAYAATYGTTGVPAEMMDGGNLRPAMIVEPLNFEGFDPDSWIKVSQSGKYTEFEIAVITKYASFADEAIEGNFGGIETIGGQATSVKYSISGNVNGKAAEIKGLKVVGNGMFGGKAKVGNVVKNITLTNLKVKGDYLVTEYADARTDNRNTPFAELEGITVNGGTIDSENDTAVVDKAYTSELDAVKVNEYPAPEGTKYANSLRVTSNVDTPLDLTFNKVVAVSSGIGKIVTVATAAKAAELIDAIDYETSKTQNSWFSIVTRKAAVAPAVGDVETSYWTGFVADKDNTDGIYTAEEYAMDAAKESATTAFTLTNNLDFVGRVRPEVKANAVTVDGGGFTISNVVITEVLASTNATPTDQYRYTMFGDKASVKDLTLDTVTIDVLANATKAFVGTLANTYNKEGDKNENVEVKNLTINVPATATVSNEIGGLYRNVSGLSGETIDLGNFIDGKVSFAENGAKYGDHEFGYIAGRITITAATAKVTVKGKNANVAKPFAKIHVTISSVDEKVHGTSLRFSDLTAGQITEDNFSYKVGDNVDITDHVLWIYFGENQKESYYFRISTPAQE